MNGILNVSKAVIVVILVSFCYPISLNAQTRLADSLQQILNHTRGMARIPLLNTIADEIKIYEPERAKRQLEEVIALATTYRDMRELSWALTTMASLKMSTKHIEEAQLMNARALAIADSLMEPQLQSRALIGDATIAWLRGNYSKSIELSMSAAKLSEPVHDNRGMARAMHLLSLNYQTMGKIEDAENYTLRSMTYSQASGYTFILLNNYHTLANLYGMTNRLDKAIEMDLKGLELCRKAGSPRTESQFLVNLGTCYMFMKKYDKALAEFNRALVIDRKHDDAKNIGDVYFTIANVYHDQGLCMQALAYLDTALPYFSMVQYRYGERGVHDLYTKCYERTGDYASALKHQKLYSSLTDSIYNEENARTLADLKTKYETERKEKELQLLKTENQVEKQQSRIRLILFSGAIIIVFLLFYLYYQRYKNRQKTLLDESVKASEEKERLRISQDLHDHVGAQLSYLVSNMDWLTTENHTVQENDQKRLQAVSDMARQAILTLRETVWALNTESITTEAFADKFKQFANRMVEFNVNVSVSFSENLQCNTLIKPNIALNLFRICQEAFSNALKHSSASLVTVSFNEDANCRFSFVIRDNGTGFNPSDDREGHYGLKNMLSRAKEIGAECLIRSDHGRGTEIEIIMPVPDKAKNTANVL